MTIRKLSGATIAVALSLFGLAACGTDENASEELATVSESTDGAGETENEDSATEDTDAGSDSDSHEATATGTWPRTITIGDSKVTIEEAPSRNVAVSSESAEIALILAGTERVVAVPSSSQAPHSNTTDLATQVDQTLPPGTDPDPELILSMEPDLVLNTARHGGEETAGQQLEQAGVPVVNIDPSAFSTPETVADTVTLVGEALGEEEKAAEVTTVFLAEISQLDQTREETDQRFLALMARGDSVMAMDDSLMLPGLITRAHGMNAGDAIGLTQTRPIDAELIATVNPDIIFLEDFQGQGEEPFAEILDNPALADVPAVANDRI